MKRMIATVVLVGVLSVTGGAQAAGCLKGAVIGGIAGHVAHHHTLLGALGGCIVGHEAAKHKQQQMQDQQTQNQAPVSGKATNS